MILAVTVANAVASPFGFCPTAMDVVVASTANSAGSGS
jgi:hypothetical protein